MSIINLPPLPWPRPGVFVLIPRPLLPLVPLPRIGCRPSSCWFWCGTDLLAAPRVALAILLPRCGPPLGGLVCWAFVGTFCQVSLSLRNKGSLWWWSAAVVSVLSFSLSWSLLVELVGFWCSSEDKIKNSVSWIWLELYQMPLDLCSNHQPLSYKAGHLKLVIFLTA